MVPISSIPLAFHPHGNLRNSRDSRWQGDEITGPKSETITRMMFHNVNGITLSGCNGIDMFVNNQLSLEVDLQGITEHCLDMTKYRTYKALQTATRQHSPKQSLLAFHSSEDPAPNQYKPGGTGVLLLGAIVSRLESNGIFGDSMGRWSAIGLRRKDQPPITVIAAYQVCPRPTNLLGNTAYHQQVRALGKTNRSHLHPRQAFIHDLQTHIEHLQSKGHDIILGGDFNESLNDRNSGIHRLITARNLVDPFLNKFPHLPQFETHQIGSRRIDLIFVSPSLLPTITKIGYTPYEFSVSSDHRACVIEFDTKRLFGFGNQSQLGSPQNRLIKSKDKIAVETFISEWFRLLSEHNVFSNQSAIDNDVLEPSEIERIDDLLGRCGKQAEKKCRRRRPEFYSQTLIQQRVRVSALRGHLHALRLGIDRTPQLIAKLDRVGVEVQFSPSIRVTNLMLSQAITTLRDLTKDHVAKRQKELEDKIATATNGGNKNHAKILAAIKKTEMNQSTYRILRNIKNRSTHLSGIDRIEIPTSWPPPGTPLQNVHTLEDPKKCRQWKIITNPSEVEYYLMLRNQLHFGQAEGTPFTTAPFVDDLDWGATSPAAEAILTGSYPFNHPTPNCDNLLRACRQKCDDEVQDHAELTLTEFRNKIRKWKEATTTSPSGRHLGWYKSLFSPGRPSPTTDTQTNTTLRDMQETITMLILSIVNYCLRRTYVLNRWRKIVNVMIFKEQGNYKIHRLRIIHIYEADFNLLLAVKWRQLLHNTDRHGWLNPGQYGGRPGCEAQSLTLLEELKYDLAYLTRRTLFNFDNDATSCYDRIVVPFASLINRKYGMHREVVALHAQTLLSAQYHLKTANGVSDSHYSASRTYPIHGTGQGSGNSPCIWLLISSTLFDVHKELAHGANFLSPDGSLQTSMSMVGFVDDSTGTFNNFQPQHEDPIQSLLQCMQHDAQTWNNLLHCTGGRLELPKCSFHVLRFDFKSNGTPVPSLHTYDDQIYITDLENNNAISIPSKSLFAPHKTLGHYKSPSIGQKVALESLRTKAEKLALLISISPITRQGALLAYHTVYNPSIRYTLPQSYFSEQELQQAQAPSLSKIIPKCGYNRNTSRSLIFGPKAYGGGGFLPWYLLQGEGQVLHFIKHWRTSTIVSDTLRVAMAWAQWQSGHHSPILEDVHPRLPFLECRWILSLREFLSKINGAISVDVDMVPPKERTGDFYIMPFARACGLFTSQELKVLNYCRLYLHVTTVSELFDSTGTKIIPDMFYCHREPWFNKCTIITLQRRPSNYQIKHVWQKLCRQWITSEGKIGLSYRLGAWLKPGHQLRRWRQTYVSLDQSNMIYHWHGNCYWQYTRDSNTSCKFRKKSPTSWTPKSPCIPVNIARTSNQSIFIQAIPKISRKTHIQKISPPASFASYVATCDKWVQDMIAGTNLAVPPFEIIPRIQKTHAPHTILAVSDGSVKGDDLTYGWVFGSSDGTIYAHHSGTGDGPPTSHRAEAWGMLSLIVFIYQLYEFTNELKTPHQQTIEFISDNIGLVTRVRQRMGYQTPYPNSTLLPDWDIVEQIHSLLLQIPHANKEINWVKGHQDDTHEDLTTAAHFNIRADSQAAAAHLQKYLTSQRPTRLPSAKCYLFVADVMIQGGYISTIRQAYLLPPYQQYVSQRHDWDIATQDTVDWGLVTRALRKIRSESIQIVKLLHEKLPTQAELSKRSPGSSGQCHYCSEPETFTHLLQCNNPLSQSFRTQLRQDINAVLRNKPFPLPIQQAILQCLEWSLNPGVIHEADYDTCFQAQQSLGPKAFLKGFFHKSWVSMMTILTSRNAPASATTPEDLLASVVVVLWTAQLHFWKSHTNRINSFAIESQPTDHRLKQYQTRLRHLYSLKDQCLPCHRDQYFPPDIDEYLAVATLTQMKNYLLYYESAIHQSVKMAKTQSQQRITSFPGFFQTTRQVVRELTTRNVLTGPPSSSRQSGAQGTPTHHKHTRWRTFASNLSIRNFFSPRNPPS